MRSMTGFGRGEHRTEGWRVVAEASSVNRKQAEVVVQLPRGDAGELENRVRKAVLDRISRGRVQVSLRWERCGGDSGLVEVDAAMVRGLREAFSSLAGIAGRPLEPSLSDYLRVPGVLAAVASGADAGDLWAAVEPALREALDRMVAMREAEGMHLAEDLSGHLAGVERDLRAIADLAPSRPARQRDLLIGRLRAMGLELEAADERVLREVALFADRCDISEEISRLGSHFAKFRGYLSAEAPGRPLDFLCQEMFREFNTIGAKALDSAIAQRVVEAKTGLERIREQVQNIE